MAISPKKHIQPLTKALQDVGTLLPIVQDVHKCLIDNDSFQAKVLLDKNVKIVKDLDKLKAHRTINKEQKELIEKIKSLYSKMVKEIVEDKGSKLTTISNFQGTLEVLQEVLKKAA